MRLFYAINFPPPALDAVARARECLRPWVAKGRWSPRENFHMTLHFIGPAGEEELPLFMEALERAAEGMAPFSLAFTGYGSFRQRAGDLIYLAAEDRRGELNLLADRLKGDLKRGDMKGLKPHITLVRQARLKGNSPKMIKGMGIAPWETTIDSIELMESLPREGGMTYRSLYSVPLRG